MKKLILTALLASGTLAACEGLNVARDPSGVTTIGDETGAGVTITDPKAVEGAEPGSAAADPTGIANAATAIGTAVTGNPGIGAVAGLVLSWFLAKRAKKPTA